MKRFRYITFGLALALITSSAFFAPSLNAKQNSKVQNESNETLNENNLMALAKFTKILSTVDKYYVDEVSFSKIIDKSIDGLLSNLDAHSGFLDKDKYKDMKVQTEGEFGGLGITIGMRDGALTIIAPIEGTPADKAGLKSKDIILRIDGNSTLNMTIDESVKLMRGKPGTDIVITIVRKGETKPFDVKITRDIIKIDSVYVKDIENENILYLRVTNFDRHVVENAKKALEENSKVDGVILDLRNNPGGLLDQAVGLVDLFVDEGVIVSQKGRIESENTEYKADKDKTIFKKPMVVLLNGGSASASEIVSGALQDHKRAVIIGEKSFGKGSVQVILPVNKDEALRLTIARYYLPSGRTIQAVGITPDVTVYSGKVARDENDYSIKENDLKKHLTTELDKIDKDKKSDKEQKVKDKKKEKENKQDKEEDEKKEKIIDTDHIYKDAQLKSAIDILKALILVKK
ncbi:MAG: S41 family peptidase [Campylobacteraceae bacterium]|nr:S41 family peptidase [Campylobacteraceae bacterium]